MDWVDSHVHSVFSDDGCEPLERLCEAAIKRGMTGLAVTDHCDLMMYDRAGYAQTVANAAIAVEQAKEAFAGRLRVYTGIELGDALDFPQQAKAVLGAHPYDVVIGSIHWGPTGEDIYYSDFRRWSSGQIHDYLLWYFRYLLRLAQTPYCDVLAHLTYPLRYIVGKCGVPVNLESYARDIDEILNAMAGEGKALELNTAGLRQEIKEVAPPYSVVERFRQLGGEYVTMGSDAHKAENVSDGLDVALDMLKRAGFRHYTLFQNRKPTLIEL